MDLLISLAGSSSAGSGLPGRLPRRTADGSSTAGRPGHAWLESTARPAGRRCSTPPAHSIRPSPGETKPEFIERRADRWRIADRIAWGELPLGDLGQVRHVERLVRSWRSLELASQLIHGDLVGNVLFAEGLAPAIIDLSLYWRPRGYSAALVVGDAIAWEGAAPATVGLIRHIDRWPQLLLRAVIFRVVVSALAKRAEPWRQDITHEYDGIVELAVSAAA